MPEQDYRDLIALLHETGGPDGKPLLESHADIGETDPSNSAGPINEFRRSHALG